MSNVELADLFRVNSISGEVSVRCGINPEMAGWRYVSFATVELADAVVSVHTAATEMVVVPLDGTVDVTVTPDGSQPAGVSTCQATLTRHDVFVDRPSAVYAAPGSTVELRCRGTARLGIGAAPAEAAYPSAHLAGDDIRVEVRGGGGARRQVAHVLAPPLAAHRLIVYEVLVPRGSWSGWPPHCHDGRDGSPYLEETYYFEHRPANGFGIHRNFRESEGLDDVFVVPHQGLVTVPAGYHCSAASPGSHMYFLNILAGDLEHDDRRTPPCFDERYTWIDGHWDDDPLIV
jgi:5-deoxy-glucuronate isomerase